MIGNEHGFISGRSELLRNDEGSIRLKLAVVLGSLAGAVVLGAGLGVAHNARTFVDAGVDIEIEDGGRGTITDAYMIDPKTCRAAFDTDIENVAVQVSADLDIGGFDVPLVSEGIWWKSTYNGDIVTEVCTTGIDGEKVIDFDNNHITITIPENAFSATSYDKNPENPSNYRNDFGPATGAAVVADAAVKEFSNANIGHIDSMQSYTQGLAYKTAADFASRACSPQAWEYLVDGWEDSIIDEEIQVAGQYGMELTRSDVTVNLPRTISLQNQYANELEKNLSANNREGKEITTTGVPDVEQFVCEPAENLQTTDRRTTIAQEEN